MISAPRNYTGRQLLDYDDLKELGKELGRPVSALYALAADNDPFAIGERRRAGAKWFHDKVWKLLKPGEGIHLRRLHYRLISQAKPIKMSDGTPFENTERCWIALGSTSKDARSLDLVPAEYFVDRRNAKPLICLPTESSDCSLQILGREPYAELHIADSAPMPGLPRLRLTPPVILQPYHVEIWCEKSTINDILEPIAQEFGVNLITGIGELSQTACVNVVERAERSQLPVRILYVSDFDPAGQSMPVAVARKIEHRLAVKGLDLDIQVRPVVLTYDQCVEYRLPRTPIKETEKRAEGFEKRFGEGATELDALEEIHPGELRNILVRELGRYLDLYLAKDVADKAAEIKDEISEINDRVHHEHRASLRKLQAAWKKIAVDHAKQVAAWSKVAKPVWRAIANDLDSQSPDPDCIDWPEPSQEADEDPDPLFDSTRDYVEQMDSYKSFQGKPTERRKRRSRNNGGRS
jgi:hypothetical protein